MNFLELFKILNLKIIVKIDLLIKRTFEKLFYFIYQNSKVKSKKKLIFLKSFLLSKLHHQIMETEGQTEQFAFNADIQ